MPLARLDHVNIRTSNLEGLVRFYTEVVGLRVGDRPPFSFGGAWLYLGDQATIHLVEVPAENQGHDQERGAGAIDHFAFMASGLADFTARLEKNGIDFTTRKIPALGNTQVNIRDPDGNRIEIQFPAADST